jgi:hypothetical protein
MNAGLNPRATVEAIKATPLGQKAAEFADHAVEDLQMKLTPMAAGSASESARATAKEFANQDRLARYQWGQFDDILKKNYTPEQRKAMGKALDEQSVLEQTGQDTTGKGLDTLPPDQRAAIETINAHGRQLWERAQRDRHGPRRGPAVLHAAHGREHRRGREGLAPAVPRRRDHWRLRQPVGREHHHHDAEPAQAQVPDARGDRGSGEGALRRRRDARAGHPRPACRSGPFRARDRRPGTDREDQGRRHAQRQGTRLRDREARVLHRRPSGVQDLPPAVRHRRNRQDRADARPERQPGVRQGAALRRGRVQGAAEGDHVREVRGHLQRPHGDQGQDDEPDHVLAADPQRGGVRPGVRPHAAGNVQGRAGEGFHPGAEDLPGRQPAQEQPGRHARGHQERARADRQALRLPGHHRNCGGAAGSPWAQHHGEGGRWCRRSRQQDGRRSGEARHRHGGRLLAQHAALGSRRRPANGPVRQVP